MEFLSNLSMVFKVFLDMTNVLMCFMGVFIGTLVGVLPGLGPVATISLLLPITYKFTPIQSIIMLAGIYYGAQYGGSTTSILLNTPGEASTAITCLDGYQMAKKGRAGAALGVSAIGSFIGGTFSTLMIMFLAPPLAAAALKFGPPESACLMLLGIVMVVYLASGSMVKSLMMALIGLLLGCIGTDLITGKIRMSFGASALTEGFDIIAMIMGLFGISEVFLNIETSIGQREFFILPAKGLKALLPDKEEVKDAVGPVARGSILGFILGIIPGGGALLASFLSYAFEKKLSKNPERFGTGYIKGVAAPETANNAAAQSSYITLLTLGLPANVVMAALMGGFLIHGITPGPLLLKTNPDIFWGVIGSMYIGNLMLLILNLPLIGLWVKILRIPYTLLYPVILLICLIGVYTIENSFFDINVMIAFGIVGYFMKKCDYPAAPLVLAFLLGPMLEKNLAQSLMMSRKGLMIFATRPIALTLLTITFFLLVSPVLLKLAKKEIPESLREEID